MIEERVSHSGFFPLFLDVPTFEALQFRRPQQTPVRRGKYHGLADFRFGRCCGGKLNCVEGAKRMPLRQAARKE